MLNKKQMSMAPDMLSGKQKFKIGPQGSLISVDETSVSSVDDLQSSERLTDRRPEDLSGKSRAAPVVEAVYSDGSASDRVQTGSSKVLDLRD